VYMHVYACVFACVHVSVCAFEIECAHTRVPTPRSRVVQDFTCVYVR